MLDRLAPNTHAVRCLIQTVLHRLKHILMFPACDATLFSGTSWFTDGGLDVVVPHFEGAATAAWLAIAGLAALVGFRRFREADL